MKLFLALSLVAATFAIVPTVSATGTCATPGTCVDASSYSAGDCNAGFASNSVSIYSYDTPAGYAGASGGTFCYNAGGFSENFVGAGAYASTPVGTAFAGADWYTFAFGGFSYCDSYAYAYTDATGFVLQDVGCPAGGPPGLPAVLP